MIVELMRTAFAIGPDPRAWGTSTYAVFIVGLLLLRGFAWPLRAWPLLREFCLLLPAGLLYFVVRGATESQADEAVARAERIITLEQAIGLFVERRAQQAILEHSILVDLVTWVYTWGHWPVIVPFVVWIWHRDRAAYRTVRNAILISGAIGLVIFASFPVAPPRLLPDWGFVDTVTQRSNSYRVLQPTALTNQYAAMPSLHFGWNLLVGIVIARFARNPVTRAFGVLLPLAMFASIVLTANHFILDGVAGGTLALLGLVLGAVIERRGRLAAQRSRGVARPDRLGGGGRRHPVTGRGTIAEEA